MVGELINIGSDAHSPDRIAHGVERTKDMLRGLGFTRYYYYEKRKYIAVRL